MIDKPIISYAPSITQRSIVRMEDLSKLNVFQKNKLIESSVKMDTVPLKIFELAVAAIDDDVALNGKELEDNTVFIHKSVLYKFFDNTSTNKYSRLKKYLSELRKKAHMEITNEVSKDKYEYIDIGALNGIFVLGRSMGFIGKFAVFLPLPSPRDVACCHDQKANVNVWGVRL